MHERMALALASSFGNLRLSISPKAASLTLLFMEEIREKRSNGRHTGRALICDALGPIGELTAAVCLGLWRLAMF